MDIIFNLPTVLGVALFIGIVALVKLLLSPDRAFERRSRRDRRKGLKQPEFPFYDSGQVLVSRERRNQEDRRCHKFIITIQKYPSRQ